MTDRPTGTVTFLMTDIEGSTRLWEQSPKLMGEAVAWHDGVLRTVIERHGGFVFTTAGDAFAAAFSDPLAAAAAAIEAQHEIGAREWDEVGAIRVRMSLDTGIAQERDDDYFGPPVNRAARILSLADGEQVLASNTTADLLRHHLEEGIRLEDLGQRKLKDVQRPEQVFAVQYGPEMELTSAKRSPLLWAVIGGAAAVGLLVILVVVLSSGGGEQSDPVATPTTAGEETGPEPATTVAGGETPTEPAEFLFVLNTVDTQGTGLTPSLAFDEAGTAYMAYHGFEAGELHLARCPDPACGAVAKVVVDEGDTGQWPSVALGANGLPIISYYAQNDADLMVAACTDPACSSPVITAVDTDGSVGQQNSIAIGADGFPVISYWDEGNNNLKVAHCTTTDCAASENRTVDDVGEVGSHTAIAIGSDGLPVIAYNDGSNASTKVAHCETADCAVATLATIGPGGLDNSITIGSDGFPVVGYGGVGGVGGVHLAVCADVACSSTSITEIGEGLNGGTSVGVSGSGFPVMSFFIQDHGLQLVECDDAVCSTFTVHAIDQHPDSGVNNSLAIWDGLPVIAYFPGGDFQLKVAAPLALVEGS